MRVLVAPDKFAGTLSAVEAAEAIAAGWRRQAPDDEMLCAPMSDGGPGFSDVLHASLGGRLLAVTVVGPLGKEVPATVLVVDDTAYIEAAQACGLHLVPAERREPERATSYGVGQMITAALDAGANRLVVGLGGSATNDGGAGLLGALGAVGRPPGSLDNGPVGLGDLDSIDAEPARSRLGDVEIVVASDVDNPLLGLRGATNVYGPQKGLPENRKQVVDAALSRFADLVDPRVARFAGAGAAGGIGFALLALGGARQSGFELVARANGLATSVGAVDLVLTGEGSFDITSRMGKVVMGVASLAVQAIRPCVVLAGEVHLGAREMRTMGVDSAYAMVDAVGHEAAMAHPAQSLADLAQRVARTWSY